MEGFVNQAKKYFKKMDTLITSDEGQIICTAFNSNSPHSEIQNLFKIAGRGSVKNITIAVRPETTASNIQINIDGKSKIILPDIAYPYHFPKYLNNGKEGLVEINEIMKFDEEISITGIVKGGELFGHVIYTIDEGGSK